MSLTAFLGALQIGLVFGLVALGVFLSFRVLSFPDLTVDGSFPLGAAVTATLIVSGVDPFAATAIAIAAGALPESERATLGTIITGAASVPAAGLIVFKSVGTALQDLALAARYYELIGASAGVPTATDLASVK